jgi:hypothetical protein
MACEGAGVARIILRSDTWQNYHRGKWDALVASAVAVDSISGTTAFGGPCCDWSTFTRLSTPRIEAHAFHRCVVIGLQSTGEASTTLAREEAEGADEEMDDFISAPKMILYRLVKVRPRDSV